MLTIDTVLQERYRIVRQLGQGGMGAVYEAVDERLDKTVAVKEILLELENASNSNQRLLIKQAFRREANSLVKARHEAVPDVTDYFSDFEREFLVMEYIEGDDLIKMLQKRKMPFLLEDVLPWLDQLLEALDYLHTLSPPIVHRDIKPQNLKLNEWNKIKLLDFGIAKSTDKTATVTQMTFIGATLNYSPIEQILRVIDPMFRELILLKHKDNAEKVLAQNTDARCDIFALGATFYHLLTNYPPVDITKRTLETWEGKEDPLPNPLKLNPDLPTSISDWLVKAMAIDRDDRFLSAVEMRTALQDIIVEEDKRKQEEKIAKVIEQEKLRKYREEEEARRKKKEQSLMHAKTERLIDIPDLDKLDKENFPVTQLPPVEPPTSPVSDDQATEAFSLDDFSPTNSSATETFSSVESRSTDYKLSDTDSSLVDTTEKLSGISYVNDEQKDPEIKFEEAEFAVPPQVQPVGSSVNKSQNVLIFSLIGVLSLFVFGGVIGIAVWMNYSGSSIENRSTTESSNTNIVETPEATPSVETNSDISGSNLNENTETVSSTPESTETTTTTVKETKTTVNPTSQPTSKPVVRQTPRPAPATPRPTIQRTPAPTSTQKTKPKPTKDPRCIYTNSC
jgi:serine/threonine protein kinase